MRPRESELTALSIVAALEADRGNLVEASARFEEAVSLARDLGDRQHSSAMLADFATIETSAGNYDELAGARRGGAGGRPVARSPVGTLVTQHNIAWTLLEMDRVEESAEQMRRLIHQALDLDEPAMLLPQALDFSVVLERLGEHEYAVLLLGATDAGYDQLGIPPDVLQRESRTILIARTKAALPDDEWDTTYKAGRRTPIEDALHAVAGPGL